MRRICLALVAALAALAPNAGAGEPSPPAPAGATPEAKPAKPPPAEAAKGPAAPAAPASAASSAAAPPSGSAEPAPAAPEKEKAAPTSPPEYYVEDQKRAGAPPGEQSPAEIYEPPPPPAAEAPAPPPRTPNYVAPNTAFWAGLRLAYFIPFGTLWFDGGYDGQGTLIYHRRLFSAYASPGPATEIDIGARLGRRYNVFAMWEHASLGTGSLDPDTFAGQQRGNTNLYGVGLRFSTEPDSLGFILEIGIGYRNFHAYWTDGTELALSDTFFDGHIGFGADIRVNRWLAISPMLVFGGGSFQTAQFSGATGTYDAHTAFDQDGDYGTLSLQIGAHADIF